jgi:Tol biopolymer transport system component
VSNRDGDFEIFTVNRDGSQETQLTRNNHYDAAPVWSPDGGQIAFISRRGTHFQLFLLDLESKVERALTDDVATVHSPAWSPDGSHIAFVQDTDAGSQILVIEVSTGEILSVTSGLYKYAGLTWVK